MKFADWPYKPAPMRKPVSDPIRRKRGWRRRTTRLDPGTDTPRRTIRQQISRHSVALISLVLAATSLAYNTWRNETSEQHRNWRQASFQVLIEAGELEQIVLYRRYFHNPNQNPISDLQGGQNWVAGWGKVAMIRDLTSLMPEPLPETGRALHASWTMHAAQLDDRFEQNDRAAANQAAEALIETIEQTRTEILLLIQNLE